MTPRSRACTTEVKELAVALPGRSPRRSRSSTSTRSATRRAPRRSSRSSASRPEHGRLPLRRPEEVRRGGQARGLRLRRRRRWAARRASRPSRARRRSPRRSSSVTEPRQPKVVLLEGPRRGGARFRRARPRLRRGQAAARARQPDGRDLGLARQGRRCRPTPTSSSSRARGPAFLEPEAGALAEVPRRRGPRPAPARSGPAGAGRAAAGPRLGGAARQLRRRSSATTSSIDPANAAAAWSGAETVLANRYGNHPIVRSLVRARGCP